MVSTAAISAIQTATLTLLAQLGLGREEEAFVTIHTLHAADLGILVGALQASRFSARVAILALRHEVARGALVALGGALSIVLALFASEVTLLALTFF